ncbi:MAG: hypothetical protein KC547_23865, partial [Anaerolineae bacterium]|nr:hypothetical protein [Anaerolineae bacterium]
MRKIAFVALLLLTLFGAPLNAQDDGYRLREPSVADYIVAIPEALARLPESAARVDAQTLLFELTQAHTNSEIFAQDFNRLLHFYEAATVTKGIRNSILDPAAWGIGMLQAWLREHPTDLA